MMNYTLTLRPECFYEEVTSNKINQSLRTKVLTANISNKVLIKLKKIILNDFVSALKLCKEEG